MKKGTKWYYIQAVDEIPATAISEASLFKYVEYVRATSIEEALNIAHIPRHPYHTVKSVNVKVSKASGKHLLKKYQVYTKYTYYKIEAPSEEDAIFFAEPDAAVTEVKEVYEYTNDVIAKQFGL